VRNSISLKRDVVDKLDSFFYRVGNLTWSTTFLSYNTLEAIDSLLSITGADISEIRLMMDVLLEAYLGKLILVFSS
jgi:hypothetical protein